MTPEDMRILKSLVAVAWADGKLAKPESKVLDGLLEGFGASKEEAEEVRAYAKNKRTLADVPVNDLGDEDREILLGNAAILTHADGTQTDDEKKVLADLVKLLGFSDDDAKKIYDEAKDGHIQLGTRGLVDA